VAEVRVGTSGWSYPEWLGRFYPNGTSVARMLDFYGRRFATVEAHATYRRLPAAAAFERWRSQVPPGFRFAPKAHLGITHRRELDGMEERVDAFLTAIAPLGDSLGPVLFSLPHQDPDLVRLDRLLAAMPPPPVGPAAAFELGPNWYTGEVIDRLEAHGATLVVVDADGERNVHAPLTVGPLAYVRLRRHRYDRSGLEVWAERLGKIQADGRDSYVFLKHDEQGDGPRYARRLAELLPGR
ncbi:MAG TPA: DUF72 domain-containing protein, partial [Acidimicrobiales bacterium]|nr:DUF72 domain-containing protein [Acidimicrobiales bacterium]